MPFLVAIFCVMGEAVCDLLGPTLMSHIIDNGIVEGLLSAVFFWGAWMLAVTLFGAGFAVTRSILASRISQSFGAALRLDLFGKIMGLSEEGADQIESGSLITRMTNDTTQAVQFVNGTMRVFLKAPITCIGSIVLASILNLRLSLIIYAVVIITGLIVYLSMKLSYPRFTLLQRAMDRVNTIVQEYLIGIRLVKAFGTYSEESGRFGEANTDLMRKGVSSQRVITITAPLITFIVGLGTVTALFFGGQMFTANLIMPGTVSAFTIYMAQMLTSLMMLTNIFNTFVRTRASTARISEVLACEDDFSAVEPQEAPASAPEAPLRGMVEFKQVGFTYPNGSGVPAIKGLSVKVEPGESLAVIGPTGSGKSTLCWLLLRFYDVNSGAILLDGRDIRSLPVDMVRKSIAIVPQQPMLFSGTVEDNIRWGDPQADEPEIAQAARQAQADFIEQMPEGLQSPLGAGAVNLSGGQRQRLSIARGLVKGAPILILDDATSALDAITEAKIRSSLLGNGRPARDRQRSIILVTQRCTTAMFADHILVLDNGEPVGYGTHAQL
ncbi:MAG: ABC transporter ATP-binding protein/permease, partial [Eggerthellaceae bacterium]|nr:ABC transporter ATP-binding protein/permease [Eggerthellaceae bacterium]